MIKYILCAFLTIFTSYAALGNIIDQILEQEETSDGRDTPVVAFDINSTICERDSDAYKNQTNILNRFPGALVLPFQRPDCDLSEFIFYPEMMEVFLSTLKRGWNICFFSHAIKDCSEIPVKTYFKYMLEKYTDKPEAVLTSLLQMKRVRFFSRETLVERGKRPLERFEIFCTHKKDLSAIGLEIESSVLFDDMRGAVMGGDQYPFVYAELPDKQEKFYEIFQKYWYDPNYAYTKFDSIRMWNSKLEAFVNTDHFDDELDHPFGDRAAYFSGILGLCADLMSSENIKLRAALSVVLLRPDYVWSKVPKREEEWNTPWYLIGSGPDNLPQKTYSAWLAKGRDEITDVKRQILESYVAPEDPFVAIGIDLYGNEFDPTKKG